MTEVVAGVASAALLSGEPFGTQEMLGTALITAALLSEVFRPEKT
jgi:drug/metabolite transporter (DMT)-like permease